MTNDENVTELKPKEADITPIGVHGFTPKVIIQEVIKVDNEVGLESIIITVVDKNGYVQHLRSTMDNLTAIGMAHTFIDGTLQNSKEYIGD